MKIEFDDRVAALIKLWAKSVGKSPAVFVDDCIKEKIMVLSLPDKSKKDLFILINHLFTQHGFVEEKETLQSKVTL